MNKCRHCGSTRVNKSGIDRSGIHKYQRFYCRDCHRICSYKIEDEIVEANTVEGLTSTDNEVSHVIR